MKRIIIIYLLLFSISGDIASAARMPDKVKKEFVIEGDKAIQVMNFLGLPKTINKKYELPWTENETKCFKEYNESGPVYILCDPTTKKINTLIYKFENQPKVIISGYWFDGETGTSPDVPKFFFSSPAINSDKEVNGWESIIEKHSKLVSSAKNFSPVENRVFETLSANTFLIEISSYKHDGSTYFTLAIDDRLIGDREAAKQKYKDCIEELRLNSIKYGATRTGGC